MFIATLFVITQTGNRPNVPHQVDEKTNGDYCQNRKLLSINSK